MSGASGDLALSFGLATKSFHGTEFAVGPGSALESLRRGLEVLFEFDGLALGPEKLKFVATDMDRGLGRPSLAIAFRDCNACGNLSAEVMLLLGEDGKGDAALLRLSSSVSSPTSSTASVNVGMSLEVSCSSRMFLLRPVREKVLDFKIRAFAREGFPLVEILTELVVLDLDLDLASSRLPPPCDDCLLDMLGIRCCFLQSR